MARKKTNQSPAKKILKGPNTDLYVVGIGASAGGLEALKDFFRGLPESTGAAYVVVQHLDPTHKSLLSKLLSSHTRMEVLEIENGMKLVADRVYVIPPRKDLYLFKHTLKLTESAEPRSLRRPIDLFFQSLADDAKVKGVGIILSGTGTEGAIGLEAIRGEGGMAMVQDPESAKFEGMPRTVIAAKAADYILEPSKMGAKLVRYLKKKRLGENTTVPRESFEKQLIKIFDIVRKQTGLDFSMYKKNTVVRRVMKRVAINQMDTMEEYLRFLRQSKQEVERLSGEFLIGVTSFFRDKVVFNSAAKKIIPYLLEKSEDKDLRQPLSLPEPN